MNKILSYIEKGLISGIIILLTFILVFTFIDVVYEIKSKLISPPKFIIDASNLMDLLSTLLVLLIGLELLETVKAYLKDDVVHVEYIILISIIAIARKVIVWDFKKFTSNELLSLAAIVISLSAAYYLIKKSEIKIRLKKKGN